MLCVLDRFRHQSSVPLAPHRLVKVRQTGDLEYGRIGWCFCSIISEKGLFILYLEFIELQ